MAYDMATFFLINCPLIGFSITVNMFFILCMMCPRHRDKIKQPLKLLLWTWICCAVINTVSILTEFFCTMTWSYCRYPVSLVSYLGFNTSLFTSLTTSVWLSFFYYTQIVPAQTAGFLWIKKNVKLIVYCIWLSDKMCNLVNIAISLFYFVYPVFSYDPSYNITMVVFNEKIDEMQRSGIVAGGSLVVINFIFCLSVMVVSTGSLVVYLSRHMSHMISNKQTSSCSQFRRQARVTISGFLQGILFVSCAVMSLCKYISEDILTQTKNGYGYSEFCYLNVYMAATTLNVGIGQAVFRQTAKGIWCKAVQLCKGAKVQESEEGK